MTDEHVWWCVTLKLHQTPLTLCKVYTVLQMIPEEYLASRGKQDTIHSTFITNLLHNVFVLVEEVCIHMKTHNCLSTWIQNWRNLPNEGLIEKPCSHGNRTDRCVFSCTCIKGHPQRLWLWQYFDTYMKTVSIQMSVLAPSNLSPD